MRSIVAKRVSVALMALVVVGLSACSGGGSNASTTAPPARDDASTATPVAAPGLSQKPTDKSYVATLCRASLSFQTAVEKSLAGARANAATSESSSLTVAAITTAFAEFTGSLERAESPPDFNQFHTDLVVRLRGTLDHLKTDPSAATRANAESPFPAPPPELRERLATAAAAERNCQTAGLTFR